MSESTVMYEKEVPITDLFRQEAVKDHRQYVWERDSTISAVGDREVRVAPSDDISRWHEHEFAYIRESSPWHVSYVDEAEHGVAVYFKRDA